MQLRYIAQGLTQGLKKLLGASGIVHVIHPNEEKKVYGCSLSSSW
jgi:hypothetical protein